MKKVVIAGVAIGVVLFALLATLSSLGAGRVAAGLSETTLFLTLLGIAAATTLARPAQMRKARVPVRRAMPPAWWPNEADATGMLAVCLGAPIIIASATGAILFR